MRVSQKRLGHDVVWIGRRNFKFRRIDNGTEIMPCDYKKYHPAWKQIVVTIKKRENNHCKLCSAENGNLHWKTGSKVVLTVAHLNQDINDNRPYNLAALCQRCHNILDMPWRMDKRNKII